MGTGQRFDGNTLSAVSSAEQGDVPDWLSYDATAEVLTIMGHRYAKSLFEHFGASPLGVSFRITERKDGAFCITKDTDPIAAAARDMLNALRASRIYVETLEKLLDPVEDEGAPTIREHAAMVRAAIAKAEGR